MLKNIRKYISILIVFSLFLVSFNITQSVDVSALQTVNNTENINVEVIDTSKKYGEYFSKYSNVKNAEEQIIIPAYRYDVCEDTNFCVDEFEGVENTVICNNTDVEVSWNFDIPETAMYEIYITYYPLKGRNAPIDLRLKIDGEYPFKESKSNIFYRIWQDDSDILTDKNGEEYTPSISEAPQWIEGAFRDTKGYYDNKPYRFYLSTGIHTVSIKCNNEPIALKCIRLAPTEKLSTYEEIKKVYDENNFTASNSEVKYFQAETAYQKSDYSLRAQSDKNSPLTQPFSESKTRYNCIGGNSWKYQSQWISWIIDAPEDGLYKIGVRYRQELIKGYFSSRRLYIDGKVPFAEANNIEFNYTEDWKVEALGEEEPYLFYLTKGKHEIKLEVVTGRISEVIEGLQGISDELMELYRRIIAITGTNPDPYRDYNIASKITDMVDILDGCCNTLELELKNLNKILGVSQVNATALQTLLSQLEEIIADTDTIVDANRLGAFSSNVSSFASWLLDLKYQPLTIDWFALMKPSETMPPAEASFIMRIISSFKHFISSFVDDYNYSSDETKNESVTVWLSIGRDQAQIIKNMASDSFTAATNINVNIRLVSATLVQAVLANNGPDVAIMVGRDQPVNLAIRNALVDLSKIDGFEEIKKEYNPTAFEPYNYNGGCYAIPDSQVFPMMFYRTDILEELNLKYPKTWDEFRKIAPILQRNNMRVGLPSSGISVFSALLMQNNGSFYNETKTDTNWSSDEAYNAFTQWTKFFTDYAFSLEYSFNNLFRTGEMPIGIADYNMYNTLKVTAPEIEGEWQMVSIPGTVCEDGTIDRSVSATGTASIIFKNTKNPESAWRFIKWWTSSEAQLRYASEMESIMGVSARQTPANVKALASMNWSNTEIKSLLEQLDYVVELSELPGGYIVTRNLANAFNDVVVNGENTRESLEKWTDKTTAEIKRKLEEFGIEG